MLGREVFVWLACTACGRLSFDPTTTGDAAHSDGSDGDGRAACFVANEPSRVAAYTFADSGALGQDAIGVNHMGMAVGTPQQSTDVPPGFSGYSLALDGQSSVCFIGTWTFDSTADHTACWWSKQTVLADNAGQFTHTCSYDTWTADGGSTYRWRINNCNGAVALNLDVPNVFTTGTWVHICQTYERTTLTRTVYINGDTTTPHVTVDTDPIEMPTFYYWCLGSYYFDSGGAGGWFTGLMYAPIWFSRVLTPAEIAAVHDQPCLP